MLLQTFWIEQCQGQQSFVSKIYFTFLPPQRNLIGTCVELMNNIVYPEWQINDKYVATIFVLAVKTTFDLFFIFLGIGVKERSYKDQI